MRTDHIKYRNMAMQVVLFIITLGLYSIYWFYVTLNELHVANEKAEGSGPMDSAGGPPYREPFRLVALLLRIRTVYERKIPRDRHIHSVDRICTGGVVSGPVRSEQGCDPCGQRCSAARPCCRPRVRKQRSGPFRGKNITS